MNFWFYIESVPSICKTHLRCVWMLVMFVDSQVDLSLANTLYGAKRLSVEDPINVFLF